MFPAPTLETPAQEAGKPRQVRIDLRSRFTQEDVRTLSSGNCVCTDSAGKSCEPSHAGRGGDSACTLRRGRYDLPAERHVRRQAERRRQAALPPGCANQRRGAPAALCQSGLPLRPLAHSKPCYDVMLSGYRSVS